jgi:integrase
MKSLKRQTVKTTKYPLANFNGVEVFLTVPEIGAKEQKYYLDYKTDIREKYYGKGSVKRKAVEFFNSIAGQGLKRPMVVALLAELFKSDLEIIQNELTIKNLPKEVNLHNSILVALKAFYAYKELQRKEGTIGKTSMYGYKHHQRKLELYFSLPRFKKLNLTELNSEIWLNYRIELLNNSNNFGKKPLKNSSVNQHFLYVAQFYSWLTEYLELPIKNHLNKLNKLNEAQQGKRFKVIPTELLYEFYTILETYEKFYFTRLYLSALFLYENNIRLSEQVLITVGDIDLERQTIRIINNKNDSMRTVAISDKAKELIIIIRENTLRKNIEITKQMYLIGGHDMLKSGIPHGQKELGIVMRRFRKKYPQFAGRTLYEHKHTSITNQFNNGVDAYKIKERANHGSITTTEIYLKGIRVVEPYKYNSEEK